METIDILTVIQIVTNIFVIIGGATAIWQYRSSKNHEIYYHDKERIQLAIDIAEYYKENILTHSRSLKELLEKMRVIDIIESIDLEKIEFFDIDENKKIYSKDQLNKLKNIRKQYYIEKTVNDQSVSYRSISLEQDDNEIVKKNEEIKKTGEQYANLMFKILNNLEIFAMYFVHETADESVVYQPLHMSYLEIVRMLYYDISYANRGGEKRFYINTIKLFNVWKEKALAQQKKETDTMRSIAEHGSVLHKYL